MKKVYIILETKKKNTTVLMVFENEYAANIEMRVLNSKLDSSTGIVYSLIAMNIQ
jgi:hypothetical protein